MLGAPAASHRAVVGKPATADSGSLFTRYRSAGVVPFAFDGQQLIFLLAPTDEAGLQTGSPQFEDFGGPRAPGDASASDTAARHFLKGFNGSTTPQEYSAFAAELRGQ
eukprot:RCo029213